MTDKGRKWLTLEELVAGPTQISFLNYPIDFEVDFVIRESARERAQRKGWRIVEGAND
jgi:hypothetical protein